MCVSQEEAIKLVQIHSVEGYGDKSILSALQETTDLEKILKSLKRGNPLGISRTINSEILPYSQARNIVERAFTKGVRVVPFYSDEYPSSLRELVDPPPILYFLGQDLNKTSENVAVVGTRRHSGYGERVTRMLVQDLIQHDVGIISGMALGIDTFAHEEALNGDGYTVAVLGSGVDIIAPLQNTDLYQKIRDKGTLVSEYPLGKSADKYTFPRRNRIIAGLSQGVVVIEAGEKSGALITAEQALEQGKEIFSVPGEIDKPSATGTNKLISLGATPVTQSQVILDSFSLSADSNRSIVVTDILEREILELLIQERNVSFDNLCTCLTASASDIMARLTTMELNGLLKRVGDMVEVNPRISEKSLDIKIGNHNH